ncbi:MAG TPA: hypothetical protein VN663_22720 [Ramlibacter sp.]|nr:hypothetical protein [Ramlibacter sp.]
MTEPAPPLIVLTEREALAALFTVAAMHQGWYVYRMNEFYPRTSDPLPFVGYAAFDGLTRPVAPLWAWRAGDGAYGLMLPDDMAIHVVATGRVDRGLGAITPHKTAPDASA